MNKTALYAILIALIVPLISYFIVENNSRDAIQMPRHYFPDSVYHSTKRGKKVVDTAWHQLKDFSLMNQEGRTVNWDSLEGKIIIADFFFTRCPTICPVMTAQLRRVQDAYLDEPALRILSPSVTPAADSVSVLAAYAQRQGADPDRWWFLTGDKQLVWAKPW